MRSITSIGHSQAVFKHRQPASIIINHHHQPPATTINYHQQSTIIYHHYEHVLVEPCAAEKGPFLPCAWHLCVLSLRSFGMETGILKQAQQHGPGGHRKAAVDQLLPGW